jgi:hypothetical protein
MFKIKNNILIFLILILYQINLIENYPIFPTILTVSIPIIEKNSNLKNVYYESRVENNYVRWLQASGADLVAVHPWTSYEEIDYLLTKVNGILFQGNPDNLDIKSSYYNIIKYIYKKTIEINDSGIKMPIISIGDDVSLLCTIIAEDNISIVTNSKNLINQPSNVNLFLSPDKTIIFKEFEQNDMKALEEANILPNNLNRFVSVKNFISDFHLGLKFNILATSKSEEGSEYISVAEGKKYPIILISFHPEYVVYEQNGKLIVPETLQAIYTSRFIGNGFVFYGRKNVLNEFTVEEKQKFGYIDPYGEFPKIINGRFNFLFKNTK